MLQQPGQVKASSCLNEARQFAYDHSPLGIRGLLDKGEMSPATLCMKAALKGTSVLLESCEISPGTGSIFLGLDLIELLVIQENPRSVMLDFVATGFQSIEQSVPKADGKTFKLISTHGARGG
jgi:hypothetical protein